MANHRVAVYGPTNRDDRTENPKIEKNADPRLPVNYSLERKVVEPSGLEYGDAYIEYRLLPSVFWIEKCTINPTWRLLL